MKINYILISLVAVLAFSSCNNDFDGFGSVKTGDVIRFVATTSDSNTRTSYGDKTTDNKWPIYWENGDNVRVVCPQAQTTKTADFTVQNPGSSTIKYTLTGENTLFWGETDEHHFYTFYPKERVYIANEETGTFTVAVPREQNAKVSKTGSESEGYTFTAVDMSAAVMAGHKLVKRSEISEGETITLPFRPLTTALDIEVLAPATTEGVENAIDKVYITSITIANPLDNVENRVELAGGFVYNAQTGSYELFNNKVNNEDAQSTFVNVLLNEPVCLRAGTQDKLTVTAFLLPKGLPNNLRIMLNCRESTTTGNMKVQSKLITASDQEVLANVGKKLSIKMGALPNPIIFSYETWMANLDEDVYLSQISLPGTHDAGAYAAAASSALESLAITQTYDIPNQFNNGVRVLDFRPACSYNMDNNTYSFDIAHGLIALDVTFDEILNNAVLWLAKHPTEFIIIQLKNESSGSSNMEKTGSFLGIPQYRTEENFKLWQKQIRSRLNSVNSDYVMAEFNPSMTLKEARGKLLFMSRDDYYPSETETSAYGGWVGCKISGWDDNAALWSKTFYTAPNHENSTEGGVGTLWVSDLYKGGTLQNVDENTKKSAIDGCLNATKNNTDISTWYMTWLNVSDNGLGLSNPGRRTSTYNSYVAGIIKNYPDDTYYNTGIIMLDWAGNSTYKGDEVLKAIIDNNFKGAGPSKKTTVY